MSLLTTVIPSDGARTAVLIAYFAVLGLLSIYGLHRYQMIYLYYRHRDRLRGRSRAMDAPPRVTVQLPLYNEFYVASRLIDSVCSLEYPPERLQVQVLDDSTDETADLVARAVARHRARGVNIEHVRRRNRIGFKAGALEAGLRAATGEFIAVFDADFVPPADFLLRLLAAFDDPSIGMVQARWEHLNRDYSLLTRVQSLLLDGHFVIEHAARNSSGRFFNFNGTAGIWRRRCIEESGGWQHDTLTEDLDLSYRAQLSGWRFVYLPDAAAPAELPVEINGFKSQQHRWAKGSVQTARKLLGSIFRSPVALSVKTEAFFHLTANFAYPLMVVMSVLIFPAMMIRSGTAGQMLLLIDLPLFMVSTASVTAFYVCSQRELGRGFWPTLRLLPALMALGIGLSVNNARAVIEALHRRGGEFTRTAKFAIERREDVPSRARYRGKTSLATLVEILLALYLSAAIAFAVWRGRWMALPFLVLFWWGFSFTAWLSAAHWLRTSKPFAASPADD